MSDVASAHGFRVEKRGYHPDLVNALLRKVQSDRDARWGRAEELERSIAETEAGLAALRVHGEEVVPEYDALGSRAQRILALVEEQATALRDEAEQAGEDDDAEARGRAAAHLAEAEEQMAAYRRGAEEQSEGMLRVARAEADSILGEAGEAAERERLAGAADFEAARRETAQMVTEFEESLARRREQQESLATRKAAELDSRVGGLTTRAEELLERTRKDRAAAEEEAARLDEKSTAEATEMLSEARQRSEQTRSRMERDHREHQRRADAINSHLDHIRQMLATLTGSVGGAVLPEPDLED
jgi:cell division septum initiation protein DivIVA